MFHKEALADRRRRRAVERSRHNNEANHRARLRKAIRRVLKDKLREDRKSRGAVA